MASRSSSSARSACAVVTVERLAQVGRRLVVRTQRDRALGGAAQRDARLRRHRIRFGSGFGSLIGGHVVARQHARQLVVANCFEVARRRQMPFTPLAPRQHAVGDLADQALDEAVLAALR